MKPFTVQELADLLGATVVGDGTVRVEGVAGLDDAGAGDLSFLADTSLTGKLQSTAAGAVVVPKAYPDLACAQLVAANPELAFIRVVEAMMDPIPRPAAGIYPSACVDPTAEVAPTAVLGANVVVEAGGVVGSGAVLYAGVYVGHGSRIGEDAVLYPNVTIYHGVTIGARTIIHAGAVVGADGFGFRFDGTRHVKVPQIGTVEIGADVEIGANTTIDRARMGKTVVGEGTKLDNLTQIAHNVRIGSHCVFAGFVGVSGSVKIGDYCVVGGQCGFKDHVEVGDRVMLYARSGVTRDLPGPAAYGGEPAREPKVVLKEMKNVKMIDSLRKTVRELEEKVRKLEGCDNETAND